MTYFHAVARDILLRGHPRLRIARSSAIFCAVTRDYFLRGRPRFFARSFAIFCSAANRDYFLRGRPRFIARSSAMLCKEMFFRGHPRSFMSITMRGQPRLLLARLSASHCAASRDFFVRVVFVVRPSAIMFGTLSSTNNFRRHLARACFRNLSIARETFVLRCLESSKVC